MKNQRGKYLNLNLKEKRMRKKRRNYKEMVMQPGHGRSLSNRINIEQNNKYSFSLYASLFLSASFFHRKLNLTKIAFDIAKISAAFQT